MDDDRGPRNRYGALRMAPMDNPSGLAIGGEMDEDTYPALVRELHSAAYGRGEVHIDLSAVEYCDLAGLRAVVMLTADQRRVQLHGVPAWLQVVMGIVGWDSTPGLVINSDA